MQNFKIFLVAGLLNGTGRASETTPELVLRGGRESETISPTVHSPAKLDEDIPVLHSGPALESNPVQARDATCQSDATPQSDATLKSDVTLQSGPTLQSDSVHSHESGDALNPQEEASHEANPKNTQEVDLSQGKNKGTAIGKRIVVKDHPIAPILHGVVNYSFMTSGIFLAIWATIFCLHMMEKDGQLPEIMSKFHDWIWEYVKKAI